jgi:rhodanese-related sulfurtransferase
MKNVTGIAAAFLLLIVAIVSAASYNYVRPDKFKEWLATGKKIVVIDIQAPAEFAKRHFTGSLETNAYAVKSDEERKRLDATLETFNASKDDVVIVCPRGGGGAKIRKAKQRGQKSSLPNRGESTWPAMPRSSPRSLPAPTSHCSMA